VDTRVKASQAFHLLVKPTGAACNLGCTYCYYLPKEALYPRADLRMSDEVLEALIRQAIAAQPVPELTFGWQGGEPTLLPLAFYRRAMTLQRQYRRPGMRILNTLQTNGTLLDDEWCRFFRAYDFLVGLSLDGPRQMHDAYRVDKGGGPTFDRAMQGLSLLQKHKVAYNVLTCVHAANALHPVEVYRFLRDEVGARFIQFIPVVCPDLAPGSGQGGMVTASSVGARQYGEFLIAVFDEWVRRDVGRVFVQIFDVALAAWLGQPPGLCVFEATCGRALVVEHNGDLYACDHFVDPQHRLGNILEISLAEMVDSARQRQFGLAKRDALPRRCLECAVRFVCNGGCPKNRIIRTPGDERGYNYLCEGYQALFAHIEGPMRFMAAELRAGRPPANVMRQADAGARRPGEGPGPLP
jgi:uncharacterized protein